MFVILARTFGRIVNIIRRSLYRDSSSALWIKLDDLRYRIGKDSDTTKAKKNSGGGGQGKGGKSKGAAAPAGNSSLAD